MYNFLKKGRVLFSLLFLALITLPFIFAIGENSPFFYTFPKIQFVPSLIAFFSGGALLFVAIMILTLLFGRVYCSSLCPLGTYQDIVIRVVSRFKNRKKRRFTYSSPKKLRYFILVVVALFYIGGVTLPLLYLDPYSNWGRISTLSFFLTLSFLLTLIFLLIITFLSAFKGRLYCNTICPVGTFLGLTSRLSLYKPSINKEACVRCQMCLYACKAQCIDLKTLSIDESRCVACFNCMISCKLGALSYKPSIRFKREKKSSQEINFEGRRGALVALGIMGGALAAKALNFKPLLKSKPKSNAITPPGSISFEHLKESCTACHACIAVCPNRVIKPATAEYGIDGVLLPVLNFESSYCIYNCIECSKVCPNNAINILSLEEKRVVKIGEVAYHRERCIVYSSGVDCGLCSEKCPTQAITMYPFGDEGLYMPSVNNTLCIGCGGCQFVCPATPQKAMVVEALSLHGVAQKASLKESIEVDEFGF